MTLRRAHWVTRFAKRWKQSVVVENRPGADTMLGTQAFRDARDDHVLLFTTHSTFTVMPLLHAKVPYDPIGDVKPISLVVEDFLGVVVTPELEIGSLSRNWLASRNTRKLNFYAAPGAPYLAYLAFQKRAGMATTFVAYNKNPGWVISDLSEGRIHIAVLPLASVLGAVHAGKIKLLAVTNAIHTPAAPNVPTVARSGYPDFTFGGFLGLFASKDMPKHLQEQIASEVKVILDEPENSDPTDKRRTHHARDDTGRIYNTDGRAAHEMVHDRSRTQYRAAVGDASTTRYLVSTAVRFPFERPSDRDLRDKSDNSHRQEERQRKDRPMNKAVNARQGSMPITTERSGVAVARVGANLGAEISGVDLRQPPVDKAFDAIQDALVENELIIFRDQITSDNLIDFGRRFGELTVHPFSPHDEKAPILIKFRNDENSPPFGTDVWHTDETFRAEPPMATILCAKEVPAVGGDTMFASMSAAFDGLSDRMQQFILGFEAIHDLKPLSGLSSEVPRRTARNCSALSLVSRRRSTPWCASIRYRDGRCSSSILGSRSALRIWTARGQSLLDTLFHQALIPQYQFRLRWAPHTHCNVG